MAEHQSLPPEELFAKVQLGIRINKRLVKVLKATAEYMDLSFASLIEGIAVTALQGGSVFGPDVLKQIERFTEIYGLDEMLDAMARDADDYELMQAKPERTGKR